MGGEVRWAGSALCDDDHGVCPHQTRLQRGRIADLALSRDAGEKDKVHAAWTTTHPGIWGLGPNAYRTSLVVSLDNDDAPVAKSVLPGTRNATFDKVEDRHRGTGPVGNRGRPCRQRHPGTDPQPEPDRVLLATGWQRATATTDEDATAAGFQFTTEAVADTMYYVGHNKNFGNVRIHDGGNITVPMHPAPRSPTGTAPWNRNLPLTMVKVGRFGGTAFTVGNVFAEPPDRHRNLPNDLLFGRLKPRVRRLGASPRWPARAISCMPSRTSAPDDPAALGLCPARIPSGLACAPQPMLIETMPRI